MRQAQFASSASNEIQTRAAHDARADGGRRMILLAPRCVTIKRRLRGVKMHLRVPVESYAGVVLAREERPSGAFFSVRLVHRDPELSVTLRAASNRGASLASMRGGTAGEPCRNGAGALLFAVRGPYGRTSENFSR